VDNPNIFEESLILLGIDAVCCEDVITCLGQLLYQHGYVKDSYIDAAIAREHIFATGLPLKQINVALPHTDAIHVNQQKIAVGILRKPVPFCVMGCPERNIPVHIVFMMAIKQQGDQIVMLQKLAEAIQDERFINALYHAQTQAEAMDILAAKFELESTHAAD